MCTGLRCGRSRSPRHPLQSAFTLIEILVVVAIIALLVAILLPSLSRARWQAKTVVCKANLEQVGVAFMTYSHEHKSYLPLTAGSGSDSYYALGSRSADPTTGVWRSTLLKSTNLLACPGTVNVIRTASLSFPLTSEKCGEPGNHDVPIMKKGSEYSDLDTTAGGDGKPKGMPPRDNGFGGSSYEYNGCYDSASDPAGKPFSNRHKRTNELAFSMATIVLVHDNDNRFNGDDTSCEPSKNGGNNCPQAWDNHNQFGMNMMFGDGHAEWVKKLPGHFPDRSTNAGTFTQKPSVNGPIDTYFIKSQYPWKFKKSRG